MSMSKGCTTNVVSLGRNKISMLDKWTVSKPSNPSWSLPKRMCRNIVHDEQDVPFCAVHLVVEFLCLVHKDL
jgi:hypothetical protein